MHFGGLYTDYRKDPLLHFLPTRAKAQEIIKLEHRGTGMCGFVFYFQEVENATYPTVWLLPFCVSSARRQSC